MDLKPSTSRSAWLVLAFLTFLNVINFVDRNLLQSLAKPIMKDLSLNYTHITLLAGFVFSLFYVVIGIFLGSRADRGNRPRLIAVGLLLWSALTAISGLAQNFWQLAAARVFVGVGEATLTPTSVALLSDVFGPRRRALASGVYYMGVPIGSAMSLIVSGILADDLGWRNCFLILGVVGVALVPLVLRLTDPPRGQMELDDASGSAHHALNKSRSFGAIFGEVVYALSHSPALVLTILGGSLINVSVGANFLDSPWLINERHFSLKQANVFLGFIILFGGCAGNFAGGWLGDLFYRRWRNGRLIFLVCAQLVITPLAVMYRLVPASLHFLALPAFFGALLITFFYGPVLATVQDLVPVRIRSTMVAVLLFSLNIFGVAPGSLLAGKLADHFKVLGYAQPVTWALFLVGLVNLAAVPLFLLAARRYERDLARLRREEAEKLEAVLPVI